MAHRRNKSLRTLMRDVIQRRRKQLGLSYSAAATLLGVDYQRYYRMEKKGPQIDDIPLLHSAFEVAPNELFGVGIVEVGSDE